MNRKAIILILFFLCFYLLDAHSDNNNKRDTVLFSSILEKTNDYPFQEGEKCEWAFNYIWGIINTTVSNGSISLDKQGNVFIFSINAKTYGWYDKIIKVRESLKSNLDSTTLLPISYSRYSYEGGYEAKDDYKYVRNRDSMYIDAHLMEKGVYTHKILPLDLNTYDFVSLLLQLRRVDYNVLSKDNVYKLKFGIFNQVDLISFTYKGTEDIKISELGIFNAHKISLNMLSSNQFNFGANMFIWLTNDKNRLPIKFYVPIKVGKVEGYMKKFSGLKYIKDLNFIQK